MGLETRSKKRVPISGSVKLIITDATASMIKINIPRSAAENNAAVVTAQLIDISISGVALDSPYLIPTGIVLDIAIDPKPIVSELKKDHEGPIKATGKVTASAMKSAGHYRLSIAFTAIEKDEISLIEDFMKIKGS